LALILTPALFLKILFFIHYLLGVGGLFKLCTSLGFDQRQTRVFSALFLLSPIFFQHTAIGYLSWINLFLFPWLIYFQLHPNRLTTSLGTAAIFAITLLQDGTHVAF